MPQYLHCNSDKEYSLNLKIVYTLTTENALRLKKSDSNSSLK